ncbi:DNA polymerase III subunit delta' [Palleronia sp. LCG004]|uniref:DNA polymerase III subunit delta' n=1 Tax=Palleronia sp. LCG004 TaxID=3079304 RepID=UPI002943627A|nr:DNA polymerase III subunit delta' [Palleronia sp. LCG004]WOI55597.1 DNA polymerase III subunit delta' [Palleronia sp. LCG004]
MSEETQYEPDRVEGVAHPRLTRALYGQSEAEVAFLAAYNSDTLHHAWLLTGPRGVGKATLAWRMARFLLSQPAADGMFGAEPASSLDTPEDHPVVHRVAALGEPRLFLMRPGVNPSTGTPRRDITVDQSRKLRDFLHLSAADGGRRVVVIDSADQMNVPAANALLKLLEEPPALTTFLLVSHAPATLLPTIRSRCRTLACRPLAPDDLASALERAGLSTEVPALVLAELASGSVGEAARLLNEDGPATYARLVKLFESCPDMDRQALLSLTNGITVAAGQTRMDILVRLIELMLSRLARHGAGAPPQSEAARGEAQLLARLAPDVEAARRWAALHQAAIARLDQGRRVNLDPSALILDTGASINDTGRDILSR